jgi:argininosuccinate lyase
MTDYTTHHFKMASHYTVSIGYDHRLYSHDITASAVHVRMLARQNIVTEEEAKTIVNGLELIRGEIESGNFNWREDREDLHMNIEGRLYELIGAPGAKVHTARSRNDQIATAMRLYMRDVINDDLVSVHNLKGILIDLAEEHQGRIMPGYTHLQRAQPILLAHHLLAYVEMFERDSIRLKDALTRTNILPLGSGALAGVAYPIDREFVCKELEFDSVSANSMDAVSDRDYLVDYLAAAAIAMMHCSRLAEEMILWSAKEFGFVSLGNDWTTGSSMMPQKKNPDFMELARGKTGRVYGNLVGLLTVLKGLPLAYNRDLQEDKEAVFDTVDTLGATLEVLCSVLKAAKFDTDVMEREAGDSSMFATDLADYLVSKGVAFREAYSIVVKLCSLGIPLNEIPIETFRSHHQDFAEDVYAITAKSSISGKNVSGGTAPNQVELALGFARKRWAKG